MADNYDEFGSLRVLYEISGLIRSGGKLENKFLKALEMVKSAVECDSASMFIYNEQKGTLEEVATVGTRVDLIESTEFEMGAGLSAWVAKHRNSVLLPDVRKSRKDGFRSFISTPLTVGDKLTGVMNVGHKQPNFFNEKHQQFLEIIAGELANTIERSKFEEELVEKNNSLVVANREIEKQQQQIIEMEKYQVLTQIAASISHEINNPLTTIIGNIELLLMKSINIDGITEQKLRVVLKEGKRIGKIIEKFRDIKKIVIKDYLGETGEKMIDVDNSADSDETEKLS